MGKKVASSEKIPVSYRFSEEVKSLLSQLAAKESRSETNMLEYLIRKEAAALNIQAAKS